MVAFPVPIALAVLVFVMYYGISNLPLLREPHLRRLRRNQIALVVAEGVVLVFGIVSMIAWPELFFFWRDQ